MPNNNWKVTVGAELDKSAEKQIQDGLKKVAPKPIEVPFKIDFKNSKEIENEMKRIVSKLTNGKGSLADFKIDTSTIFDDDLGKRIEKLNGVTIKYKNELGEVISELYKFNQIGSNIDSSGQEEAIMGWSKAMSSYSQNTEKATSNLMKQKELVEQMKLLQIQADKSGTTLNQDNLTGFDTANKNNNIKEMTHYLKLAKTEYSQLNAMMEKDLPISGLENMKKNIGTMPIDIQNVETSFKKLQVQPEELRTRIDQLGNSFKSLENFKGAEADKVKQYNLLKNEITGVTKEVKSLIAAQQQQISLDDKTKFSSSITSWSNDNIKGAKLFRVELERIRRELVDADKTKFTSLKKEFGSIQKQTEAMGKSGRTAFQEIGNNFKKFASWYGIAGVVTSAVRGVKQMVSTVVELDQSLVDLQQATGFTAEETGKLLNTYIDLGQELGATGTEVAQAADVWLRQGKSIAETNELIRDSMVLSKIGQIDSAQSTQYLTSAMKGYKVEVSDVLGIIDKLAAVDLNSATSVGGLAEAMSRTANGARIAGIEMDKLLGMLAVVGEVTQKSMDSVGESFKTIFARMGNVKLGKFVDEDGNDITTEINDVEKILNKVDIKLRDSATEFRNFGNVLDDVGNNWSKFNDVEQNAIASAFAGVRQRESIVALFENYGDSLKYTEISANSAGTAMEKFSAYEESVEAKTKRLQASLQELATDTLDSGVVKGFLDLANGVVKATTAVGGLVPIIITLGILLPALKTSFGTLNLSLIATQVQVFGLGTAFKTLIGTITTFLATNPIGQVLALGTAVTGLVLAYNKYNTTMERLTEASNLAISNFNSLKDAADSNANKVENLASKYESLSKGVNNLGENISLTTDEYSEYNNIVNEIADMFPELITGYTNQGDAILSLKGNVESLRDAYKEAQLEAYNLLIANGENADGDDIISQYKELFRDESSLEKTSSYFGHTSTSDAIDALNKLLNATTGSVDDFKNLYNELYAIYGDDFDKISNAIDTSDWAKWTEDDLHNMVHIIKSNIQTLQSDINSSLSNVRTLANAYLMTNEDYDKLDEQSKTAVSLMVNSINEDIASGFDSKVDVGAYVSKLISKVNDNQEAKDALTNLFTIDFSKMSLDEAKSEIDRYIGILSDILGEDKNELKIRLGFDNIKVDETSDSISDSISRIKPDAFDTLNKSLDDLDKKSKDAVSSVKELNQVLYDQSQGTKLTSEQAYKLITQYPQLTSALEKTTDGYAINEEAIDDVREALINQETANANAQLNMTKDTLDAVKDRVEAYGIELEAITNIQSATSEQGNLPWQKIFGTMDGASFNDETMRVTNPMGSFIAQSKEQYDKMKQSYQEQKLIYDTVGKMGNLQERISGLSSGLLSDSGFGVNKTKSAKDKTKSAKDKTKSAKDKTKSSSNDPIKDAFDLGTKDKKGKWITGKNDLDHKLAMEEITQKKYLKGLEKINEATFGENKKTHLENYRQYLEEIYKGKKQLNEKKLEKAYKDYLDTTNKIIAKYGDIRDTINRTADNQTGDKQIGTLTEGIKFANKEIKYIEKEIKKLNKRKITNLFTQDDYDSQLANLQSALSKARSSIDDFNKSISESIKKSSEETMDIIEKSFNKTTEYWENQKKDYSDIIKAQKDILQLKKEQNEYEKSIAKKTKEISKIESRMADLSKAAMTGDRQANAELKKLEEDLADKKEDLSDTQSDHEYDLANDALDKALDDNDKIIDAKLKAIKTEYEERKTIQEDLFKQLETLTTNAKNFTIAEYSAAIDEIASKFAQSGIVLDDTTIGGLKGAQGQPYNNANPVYSILGTKSIANKSQDTSSLSGLNKFLASQGYTIANKNKMVELAQALGLYNITSPDMVGTDQLGRANKNLIMEELKRLFSGSTFAKGGIAKLPKMMGEDGIAFVRNNEAILTVEQGKLFKELVNNIKPLNNLVKLSTPNLSGITNNNNSPNISIPITIQGNATPSTVSALNNAGNNIVKQIMDEVRKL